MAAEPKICPASTPDPGGRTRRTAAAQALRAKVRDALVREAIVYAPARGKLAFTVPHCARFVRRRHG